MTDQSPPSPSAKKARLRRGLLFGGLALAVFAGVGGARWYNVSAQIGAQDLSAPEALARAAAGEILLIDIRRPEEWARTGVGQGAVPLDMRRADFAQALLELTERRTDAPVALICARGVRSARLARRLTDAGLSNILDVPEGMFGSGAGPGWLARGLPTQPIDSVQIPPPAG